MITKTNIIVASAIMFAIDIFVAGTFIIVGNFLQNIKHVSVSSETVLAIKIMFVALTVIAGYVAFPLAMWVVFAVLGPFFKSFPQTNSGLVVGGSYQFFFEIFVNKPDFYYSLFSVTYWVFISIGLLVAVPGMIFSGFFK